MNANHVETKPLRDRLAVIGVTALGLALCGPGVGKVATSGQWLSLPGIAGSLLGAAALAVVGARLTGKDLPFVRSDLDAIKVVIAVGLVKFVVATAFLGA